MDWADCKREVLDRAWCQATWLRHDGLPVCLPDRHEGHDAHHRWPEDRRVNRHDPDRVLLLCRKAHDWAHAHPAAAAELGLLRGTSEAPTGEGGGL